MTCSQSSVYGWRKDHSQSMPFCDWLDVTYSPDDFPKWPLLVFLKNYSSKILGHKRDQGITSFVLGDGVIKFEERSKFCRVSSSGSAVLHLRAIGIFQEFLSELSASPHTVTRLDAAVDTVEDGADAIARFRRRYRSQPISLSRKSLPAFWNLQRRPDGRESGTMYSGYRTKARVTARVYDKAWEAYCKRSELMPPTTRYELTIRGEKDRLGPSLKDAADPTGIFWHYASPALLKAPRGVPEWTATSFTSWNFEHKRTLIPSDVLKQEVDRSVELDILAELSDGLGTHGREHLIYLLAKKIGVVIPARNSVDSHVMVT